MIKQNSKHRHYRRTRPGRLRYKPACKEPAYEEIARPPRTTTVKYKERTSFAARSSVRRRSVAPITPTVSHLLRIEPVGNVIARRRAIPRLVSAAIIRVRAVRAIVRPITVVVPVIRIGTVVPDA